MCATAYLMFVGLICYMLWYGLHNNSLQGLGEVGQIQRATLDIEGRNVILFSHG